MDETAFLCCSTTFLCSTFFDYDISGWYALFDKCLLQMYVFCCSSSCVRFFGIACVMFASRLDVLLFFLFSSSSSSSSNNNNGKAPSFQPLCCGEEASCCVDPRGYAGRTSVLAGSIKGRPLRSSQLRAG